MGIQEDMATGGFEVVKPRTDKKNAPRPFRRGPGGPRVTEGATRGKVEGFGRGRGRGRLQADE